MRTQTQKLVEKNQALIALFESKGFDVKISNHNDDVKEWAVMYVCEGEKQKGCFLFQEGEMRQGVDLEPNLQKMEDYTVVYSKFFARGSNHVVKYEPIRCAPEKLKDEVELVVGWDNVHFIFDGHCKLTED
jgi:hypothetical protein